MCSLKIVCLLGGIAFGIHLEDTVRPRIFNGSPIRIENRPFMVSLNHKRKGFVCGGSILNKYWVLTASHCLPEGENPCNYYIRGGSTYLNSGSIRFLQKAVYFYSTKMNAMGVPENDILLLRPKNAFRFSRLLQPIKLPREGEQPPSKLWVTGWGATYATPVSTNLQMVELDFIPQEECRNNFSMYRDTVTDETHLCYFRATHDSCRGDSGGPLASNTTIYGIVSFGICGMFPGIYTKVAYYNRWINEVIKSGF